VDKQSQSTIRRKIMPKVVIDNNSGITQARGRGFQQLSESGKGFVREVKSSGTITLGSTDSDLSSGILIPANAIVEMVSIKVLTLGVDAAGGNYTAHTIDGIKVSGSTIVFADDLNVFTGGDAVGTVRTYMVKGATADGSGDEDGAFEACPSSSSQTTLTLTDNITAASFDSAADTLPQVEVVVQYVVPKF
jgi:hypothetical protein